MKGIITDIMIVSGRGHAGHFLELLGSGADFGARFTYEIQAVGSGCDGIFCARWVLERCGDVWESAPGWGYGGEDKTIR